MSLFHRSGARIPMMPEIERYGAGGEEVAYRLFRKHFDCVIRNIVVPHGKTYLEKDFLIVSSGVPFVIEVKYWKGSVRMSGDMFLQTRPDGTEKELKNPVGTTAQFIREAKKYYGYRGEMFGLVVFADPACVIDTPEESEGIFLLPPEEAIRKIKAIAKSHQDSEPFDPTCMLRCTRLYSGTSEFCKGILVDPYLPCFSKDGAKISLDTAKIKFITVKRGFLFAKMKLFVTFSNDATGIFRAKDQPLVIGCLDGSFKRFALKSVRTIVF